MFATKAIHFEPYSPTNGIVRVLNEAFNTCIPYFDDDLDEANIEIAMRWIERNKPDYINKLDRDIVKESYLQFKRRKSKTYEIDMYLTMFRKEDDTVDSIMKELKIHPKDIFLRVYIQENM